MARLDKSGPATTADLARAEAMKPQSMRTTVAALEEMGSIIQQSSATAEHASKLSDNAAAAASLRSGLTKWSKNPRQSAPPLGCIDRIQITVFPVIAAQTGDEPVFAGAGDFDLDLLETRTLDGRTQELVYRPTLRTWPAS